MSIFLFKKTTCNLKGSRGGFDKKVMVYHIGLGWGRKYVKKATVFYELLLMNRTFYK